MMKEYSILIGGEAGDGSRKAGLIIAKLLSHYGYRVFIYEDYQSVIKGGHSFSLIIASKERVSASKEKIDFLLALNKDTAKRHIRKISEKKNIIYNSDDLSLSDGVGISIEKITKEFGGIPIMKNIALVASFAKIIGIDWITVKKVIKSELLKLTNQNVKIAQAAYNRTKQIEKIKKLSSKSLPLISGNEAIALGALNAGLEAYVGYPMTPVTGILNYMSSIAQEYGLKVIHPENEIAVINMAIGLSFSGKRVMIATSGGGFALMNEALSLAAQAEVPLVIVEGQRMGPSTGVPTYGGQSDLLYILNSGHGDFRKFIVAPGDAEEAFYLTGLALNISWKYQIPSIVISDKDLCESTYSFDENLAGTSDLVKPIFWDGKGEYRRYSITKDGISPLAFPGRKQAVIKGTSYEHNETGIAIEDEKNIRAMQKKRALSFRFLKKEVEKIKSVKIYGNKKSSIALIVWGSVKGVALEATKETEIKMIQPIIMDPFPEKQMKQALNGVKKVIVAELNSRGQLALFLKQYGIKTESILKSTGRPFTVDELVGKIKIYQKRWMN